MLAKVIQRSEGRVVVAFEAETPAEGLMLGLVATDQTDQKVTLMAYSGIAHDEKPPRTDITVGSFCLRTVEMIQGR